MDGDEVGNFVEITHPAFHFAGQLPDEGGHLVQDLLYGQEALRLDSLDVAPTQPSGGFTLFLLQLAPEVDALHHALQEQFQLVGLDRAAEEAGSQRLQASRLPRQAPSRACHDGFKLPPGLFQDEQQLAGIHVRQLMGSQQHGRAQLLAGLQGLGRGEGRVRLVTQAGENRSNADDGGLRTVRNQNGVRHGTGLLLSDGCGR